MFITYPHRTGRPAFYSSCSTWRVSKSDFRARNPKTGFLPHEQGFRACGKVPDPCVYPVRPVSGCIEWTFENFDLEHLIYNDYRMREKDLEGVEDYKRYKYSNTGISPLAVPGEAGKTWS